MELSELEVRIYARLDDLRRDIKAGQRIVEGAGKKMGESLDLSAKNIGRSMTRNVTLPLAAAGAAVTALGFKAFQAAAKMDTMERGLRSIMGSGAAATREIAELTRVAQMPGISFETAVEGSMRLQNVGLAADRSRRLLLEMANANALVGGSADNLSGALLQLSQTIAYGTLQGDELRIIAERIPAVMRALKSEFGTTNTEIISEMLKTGELSMDALVDGLTRGLAKIPRAEAGIQVQIDKMKDMIFRELAAAGKDLIPIVQEILPDLLDALKSLLPIIKDMAEVLRAMIPAIKTTIGVLRDMAQSFSNLSPAVQTNLVKFALILAAVGPLTTAFAALRTVVGAATVAVTAFGSRLALERALFVATTGVTGFSASLAALGGTMSKLVAGASVLRLLFNPITAVIAALFALTKALDYVREGGDRYAEAIRRQVRAQDALDVSASKNAEAVKGLMDEYRGLEDQVRSLTKAGEPTADQQARMRDILNQISTLSPELVTGYNKQGQAIGLLEGAYRRAADEAERLAKAAAVAAARPIAESIGKLSELRGEIMDAVKGSGDYVPGSGGPLMRNIELLKKASRELGRDLLAAFDPLKGGSAMPTGAAFDSIIGQLDRKIKGLKDQMKSVFDPPEAAGMGTGTTKRTGVTATKGMSDAQQQAQALKEQLYEVVKAIALGEDATASSSLAYDVMAGKVFNANKALAAMVIAKLQDKEATDAQNEAWKALLDTGSGWNPIAYAASQAAAAAKAYNEERRKALADVISNAGNMAEQYRREQAMLTITTEQERVLWELREGSLKNLPAMFRPFLIARARSLDQARAAIEVAKIETSGMHGLQYAATQAMEAYRKFNEEQAKTKDARIADYIKEINLEMMKAAGASDEVIRRMTLMSDPSLYGDEEAIGRLVERFKRLAEFKQAMEQVRQIASTVTDALLQGFQDVIDKGIGGLVSAFKAALVEMAMAFLRSQLTQWLTGVFAGMFNIGGGGGNFVPGSRPGSFGGYRAAGGPVTGGMPFVVGEHGPEVFVPQESGRMVDAGRSAAARGGDVYVTMNVTTPDADSFRRSGDAVTREIARGLRKVAQRSS